MSTVNSVSNRNRLNEWYYRKGKRKKKHFKYGMRFLKHRVRWCRVQTDRNRSKMAVSAGL